MRFDDGLLVGSNKFMPKVRNPAVNVFNVNANFQPRMDYSSRKMVVVAKR